MIDKQDKVYGKNFVVIGGDTQMVNSIERVLFFAGATVQVSMLGNKGIYDARDFRPDLVVLESSVSDMSAADIISFLQSNEATKEIPVVIIANQSEIPEYKKLFITGTQDYLRKDEFEVLQLILKIEAILRNQPAHKNSEVFDFSESERNISFSSFTQQVRLLIVEDDSLLRNLLSIRLDKSGIQFQFCHSGTEAISMIKQFVPTIIILDLMLPGKDGLEVLTEIRQISEFKSVPVIIFSNRDDDAERQQAENLGVSDFLVKATTDLGELVQLVIQKGKVSK